MYFNLVQINSNLISKIYKNFSPAYSFFVLFSCKLCLYMSFKSEGKSCKIKLYLIFYSYILYILYVFYIISLIFTYLITFTVLIILQVDSSYCLLSFYFSLRTPFSISCIVGLLATSSVSSYLPVNVLISHSFL